MKTAEDILRQKGDTIVYASPETTIRDAVLIMIRERIGSLIVGGSQNILGIWTERDYLRNSMESSVDIGTARLGDYMRDEVCIVPADWQVIQLNEILLKKRQRHLLVQKEGNVIGLLSSGDIMEAILEVKTEDCNRGESCRRVIENELKRTNDFLDRIIQSSPNVIIAANRKGKVIIWNRAAEQTLGYPAKNVIGRMHIKRIYPEGMAEEIMALLRGEEYGGPGLLSSFPMVFIKKGGEEVRVKLSAALVYNDKNEEIASLGIFIDFEEQLDMARRLKHTQHLLLQSEKLAAMGRLTSLIAHEVNNPLYGIMNTLELLKTEIPETNEKRAVLEMALDETRRLSDTLRKMLSFARPGTDGHQLTDVNRLLDEIITLHRKQFIEQNIIVKLDFTEKKHTIQASKNQLRQVFLNIITNAQDAMPEGGTLSIRTRSCRNHFEVEIGDSGVGISEKNMGRIFDTFFSTKDDVKGAGHGLSVCHTYIKEHGGDISVESQIGEGTLFTITLPFDNRPPAVPES